MERNLYEIFFHHLAHGSIIVGMLLLFGCSAGTGNSTGQGAATGDQTPPVITLSQNITVVATSANGILKSNAAIAAFLNATTAIDNVDGNVMVSNNAPAIFPVGLNTVLFTASDTADNSITSPATVNVLAPGMAIDQIPPVITLPQNITVVATSANGIQKANTAVTAFLNAATAIDNVDGNVMVSNNAPTIIPVGQNAVLFSATDAAGNMATATAYINVLSQGEATYSGIATDATGTPVAGATPVVEINNGATWKGAPTDASGKFSMIFNPSIYPNAVYFQLGVRDLPAKKLQEAWYRSATTSTPLKQHATQIPIQNLPTHFSAQLVLQAGGVIQVHTNAANPSGATIKIYDHFSNHQKVVSTAGVSITEFVLPAGSYTIKYEPTWPSSQQADSVYWSAAGQTFDPAKATPMTIAVGQTRSISFTEQRMTAAEVSTLATSRINHYRQLLGLAPVTNHAQLAQTALNHSTYLKLNSNDPSIAGLGAHTETAALPGFTGISALDRYIFVAGSAPATWSVGENFYTGSDILIAADWFINSVYHQVPLLHGNTAFLGTGRVNGGWTVMNMGTTFSPAQRPLYVYPANGQVDVPTAFYNGEMPDPLLGSGLTAPTGPAISMNAPGHRLIVNAATFTETSSGTAIPLLIIDAASDPNGRLNSGNVFFFPHQVLKQQTSYTVNAVYTLDGIPGNLSWNFTTGWG